MTRIFQFLLAAAVLTAVAACDSRPKVRGKAGADRSESQRIQTDTPPPHGGLAQRPGEDASAAAASTTPSKP